MISPRHRSALFLAVVALAALGVSLVLAFAPAPWPRPGAARSATTGALIVAPTVAPSAASTAAPARPQPSSVGKLPLLWTMLTPWALAVDALAALGIAVVLVLRHGAQRRRSART